LVRHTSLLRKEKENVPIGAPGKKEKNLREEKRKKPVIEKEKKRHTAK